MAASAQGKPMGLCLGDPSGLWDHPGGSRVCGASQAGHLEILTETVKSQGGS